jgi:asparagine synthase (glutamine-hydrolysing)
MSGIAGLIYFSKYQDAIKQMTASIKHRGVDGICYFESDKVQIANLKLIVTPESEFEIQPLTSSQKNTITADARIDNRDELIEKLHLKPTYCDVITDSEIILAAYEYWGENCLYHLIGDFAFAIWDESKQQLFCGRDHLGVRPFYYYYKKDEVFAFASEIKALLALDFVPKEINEEKIAIYLCWLSDNRAYKEDTFYKEIVALKPAHRLIISRDSLETKFCWDFNLERFEHLKTEDDYINAFKECFIEAVKCRIRTNFGVASHLSGGLDSSSVVCVANKYIQKKPLITLHDVTGHQSTDETYFAKAVLKENNLKHFWVSPKKDFWECISTINQIFDRPDHFNVVSQRQLAQAEIINAENCRILLSGHDGDTVVTQGSRILTKYLRSQEWGKFDENLKKYVQYLDLSYIQPNWNQLSLEYKERLIAKEYIFRLLEIYLKKMNIKLFLNLIRFLTNKYTVSILSFCKHLFSKLANRISVKNKSIFQNKYVPKSNTTNDIINTNISSLERRNHFNSIYSAGIIDVNEQFNHIGTNYSFIVAFPFLDKRLIELCLVVPAEYNFGDGKLRCILREAMKGNLPNEVYNRTNKGDLTDYIYHVFTQKIDFISFCENQNQEQSMIDYQNAIQLFKKMLKTQKLEIKYKYLWKIARVPNYSYWINNLKNNSL